VNARELFEALASLPGARTARSATREVAESRVVGGVEVALTSVAEERPLRAAWRQRSNGGHMPLLLVADDPAGEGHLRALGPLDASGPIRAVSAEDLLRAVERLPGRSSLVGVRELAEELGRLDRTGVAGLLVHGLGTEHLLGTRLRRSARWTRLAEVAPRARDDWREILSELGYTLERRSDRGWTAHYEGRPAIVVLPVGDPASLSRLDAEGRPPEGVLLNACRRENVPYGILAAGPRLRLFEARPHTGSAVGRYLELDAASTPAEDRPLLGLLSPAFLAGEEFAALMDEARRFGAGLRQRLDRSIRQQVLPILGRELGRWAEGEGLNLTDDERRGELEAAALTFVFRALFLLYAESAGHLPVAQESYRRRAFSQIVADAHDQQDELDPHATELWDRVQMLVRAMRTGNRAIAIPAYNGGLFAADGFEGAEVLERASVPDAALGPALTALGIDPESGTGTDYSSLAIGHLGHIYEGLLSLRLSVADRPYAYDPRADRYLPAGTDEAEVQAGELLWLTDEGGRKGGGVYYTPEALVRHLVRTAVMPAFEEHLSAVGAHAEADPAAAAEVLFDFRVLDPACGSAHFLVVVVDELADRVASFLAERPLPEVQRLLDDLRAGAGETYGARVEDVALLRRLVLKRCVYGVDLSAMGAEIAKVSLWLASFVPGLALSYLDHNVRVGNSLVGVARVEQVRDAGEKSGQIGLLGHRLREAVAAGAEAANELLLMTDRTPEEVTASAEAERQAEERVSGARALLDVWTADALGLEGARAELDQRSDELLAGATSIIAAEAGARAEDRRVLHWPLAFPEAFVAENPGFDAVVGNPPWEEVTIEELAFYARYAPGLRALPQRERERTLDELRGQRPELADRLADEQAGLEALRRFFAADTGYAGGPGDPDLYKYFCERYRRLLRRGGALGVVLPRSAFLAKGSAGFREWLFESTRVRRLDFLLNRRRWIFDTHPQYTVALLAAAAEPPEPGHRIEAAGVADSAAAFARQAERPGIALVPEALGRAREVPLLRSQAAADLLARFPKDRPFPFGAGRWRCFPVGELHETNDRSLWSSGRGGRELWKGESFERYDPHGAEVRPIPASDAVLRKARKPRPGGGSLLGAETPVAERAGAVAAELEGPRLAFRDVTNRTNARTIIAALVPPGAFLTNKAPYLAFLAGSALDRAACLGVMNSLAFDWQARRFVETNVNFFILELLSLPALDEVTHTAIARAAARLSCPDERFAAFASAAGVDCGPLEQAERTELEVEVDANVAAAYGLSVADLDVVLEDFSADAVAAPYRERLRSRLSELARSHRA
jgi:hypothetical protein